MNLFAGSLTAFFALVTKSLPSDEVKLQWMKNHAPRIYYAVRKHILINAFRYIKHHIPNAGAAEITAYVNYTCLDMTPAERADMETLLLAELK